jgi:hypothetical protein
MAHLRHLRPSLPRVDGRRSKMGDDLNGRTDPVGRATSADPRHQLPGKVPALTAQSEERFDTHPAAREGAV